jgi:hypothetical protein
MMHLIGFLFLIFVVSIAFAFLFSISEDFGIFDSGPSAGGNRAGDALRPSTAPPPGTPQSVFRAPSFPGSSVPSSAKGVHITNVIRSGTSAATERLILKNVAGHQINISGWTIRSNYGSAVIPQGYERFHVDPSVGPVVLSPGATAVISTESSPLLGSYRENQCTWYLDQTYASPNLSKEYFASCMQKAKQSGVHYLNTWRIYLGRSQKLYHPLHDRIRIIDGQGRVADEFLY